MRRSSVASLYHGRVGPRSDYQPPPRALQRHPSEQEEQSRAREDRRGVEQAPEEVKVAGEEMNAEEEDARVHQRRASLQRAQSDRPHTGQEKEQVRDDRGRRVEAAVRSLEPG